MKKEDILAASREENRKEEPREAEISRRGESGAMLFGMTVGVMFVAVNAALNHNDILVGGPVMATYISMIAYKWLYRGIRLKDRGSIAIGIFSAAAAALCAALFFIKLLSK